MNLPLLLNADFVFDDIEFVRVNPELQEVRSLSDALTYTPQATKPISNFVLATSHLLGGKSPFAHRVTSLFFHLLTVLLFFIFLRKFLFSYPSEINSEIAFFSTTIFAVHALQTETLAIAQFRGEILSALTLLASLLCVQKWGDSGRTRWISLAALLSIISTLSKEVALFTVPACTLVVAQSESFPKLRRQNVYLACLMSFVLSASFLFVTHKIDATKIYTYDQRVGLGVFSTHEYLVQSVRAFFEGVWKLFSGQTLSIIRMSERSSFTDTGVGLVIVAVILLVGAFNFFHTCRRRFFRLPQRATWPFLLFLSFSCAPYLLIPNVNVGSEHYWYLATGFAVAFALAILEPTWLKVRQVNPHFVGGILALFVLYQGLCFRNRSLELRNQTSLYFAETQAHPESAFGWRALLNALLASHAPELAEEALKEFAKLSPDDAGIPLVQLGLAQMSGDWEAANSLLKTVRRVNYRDRVQARIHRGFALFASEMGHCPEARAALKLAEGYDAVVKFEPELENRVKALCG